MTTHRVHKNKNYSVIHNEAVINSAMSFKAKGILWYLLSKPDGWECRTVDLIAHSTDGKAAITSGLVELEDNGYIVRWKQNAPETGKFIYRSEVFECIADCKKWSKENSTLLKQCTRFSGARGRKSASGHQGRKTSDGKSSAGKSGPIVSTDLSSIDSVSTDLPPIVPQAMKQPGMGKVALLPTAEQKTSGDDREVNQGSPVQRLEAVGEVECSAAAPRPENFERTAYGSAPSPIMSHYGMAHMVLGRKGVNLNFKPQLIRGMRKLGQDWPGSHALTTDGRAIAHIRKLLSNLTKPQEFEAAWARLELAWEEGAEAVPIQRLTQAEELAQRFAYYTEGAA